MRLVLEVLRHGNGTGNRNLMSLEIGGLRCVARLQGEGFTWLWLVATTKSSASRPGEYLINGEREMSNELYHFVECGLDDVWLMNGFERHDSPRGQGISIKDIDSLHRAIGVHLSRNKRDLTGAEIRFPRQEMLMSQAVLAGLLDVKELTVHRWETGKNSAPKTAEALIRFPYLEQIKSRAGKIRASLRRITDLEDGTERQNELVFRLSGDDSHNWALAA